MEANVLVCARCNKCSVLKQWDGDLYSVVCNGNQNAIYNLGIKNDEFQIPKSCPSKLEHTVMEKKENINYDLLVKYLHLKDQQFPKRIDKTIFPDEEFDGMTCVDEDSEYDYIDGSDLMKLNHSVFLTYDNFFSIFTKGDEYLKLYGELTYAYDRLVKLEVDVFKKLDLEVEKLAEELFKE